MPSADITSLLLSKYPLVSDQVDKRELAVILRELGKQQGMLTDDASVVEFGCYIGTTSLFIQRLLDAYASKASFHVYDSFAGLPEKVSQDASPAGEQFKAGELTASRKDFEMQFKKAGLRLPKIHKAWFNDLRADDVPDDIAFAYLDGDYYESIRDSLYLIQDKLMSNAVVVIDDYANEALPGTAKAVNEWLTGLSGHLRVQSSLAIISDIKT
ncbi:MAG: TylF/MycF/NovP-related O-methyltransferase [Candidatus Saccharimonadales bacterium]